MKHWNRIGGLALAACLLGGSASALTVPYTEEFATDAASWVAADGTTPLGFVAGGGPDGSAYVTTLATATSDPGTIQFRGNAANGASGGAFTGDWSGNVLSISAFVRHDSAAPVSFFFRITTGTNFPAHVGVVPVPVAPNTWTQIDLLVDPSNPLLISEFGDFETTFGAVTNVQIGAAVQAGLEGVPVQWDLDRVTIAPVPEPGSAALVACGLLGLARRRRRATR